MSFHGHARRRSTDHNLCGFKQTNAREQDLKRKHVSSPNIDRSASYLNISCTGVTDEERAELGVQIEFAAQLSANAPAKMRMCQ
ncbi:MAG: hypothetical protein ACLURV_07385 [Gallintestinimicrobium sp.]